jgi:hypothetical protein
MHPETRARGPCSGAAVPAHSMPRTVGTAVGDLIERAQSSPTLRDTQVRNFPTTNEKTPTPVPFS